MDETLIDYINFQDAHEQLLLLKVYFELDTVLSQFMIDFEYFGTNAPTMPFSAETSKIEIMD